MTASSLLFSFFLFSSLNGTVICEHKTKNNKKSPDATWKRRKPPPICDVDTYGVIFSPRTVNAVTYGIVSTFSKAVRMSHILWCYLSYVGKGSTSHDAMHFGVVQRLSKNFKCSIFANAVKATSVLPNHWRCSERNVSSCGDNDDMYMHGVAKNLYYYLNETYVFVTSPRKGSWKPHTLSTSLNADVFFTASRKGFSYDVLYPDAYFYVGIALIFCSSQTLI